MNLITAREIEKFRRAGIEVSLDSSSGHERQNFAYPRLPGKTMVVFQGEKPWFGENSNRIVARPATAEFVPVIDGEILGRFTGRIGSINGPGSRWFAGLFRKLALMRATWTLMNR